MQVETGDTETVGKADGECAPRWAGGMETGLTVKSRGTHTEVTMNKEDLSRYADDLLRTAMYRLDWTDAEDLVQETMLAALLAIEQGRQIGDPRAWLKGVLYRKYYDFLRQKYRHPTVSFDALYEQSCWEHCQQEDEGLRQLERTEEAEKLRRELAHQAGIYREVLARYYMRGESIGDIARAMKIPANTVKSRLHAGREHIRKDFTMEKYTKQSYEPEQLNLGISGECGINGEPFSLGVSDSRIKQNLLILAYDRPVTLRELSEALGIAAAYIEPEVERLVDGELMKRVGDKVYTDFIICREEDRQASVGAQRELADEKYREIWEIVEQGLMKLREQDFYQKQRVEARRKLESRAVIAILQRAEWSARKEVTGELPYAAYPDRKNGGKWFALGQHFTAHYNADSQQYAYRGYWIDGQSNRILENYDGHRSVGMHAYDCQLGHTYLVCSQRGIPEDVLHKILYLTAYGKEKELALVSPRILEEMDVLFELDLLYRGEDGRLECLVPVISRADKDCMDKLGEEYGNLIGRKFHDEYLALMRYPVKLPTHLKSVTKWYCYQECGKCISMMLTQRAREAGLFLPGYNGPAPSIYLVVEG